MVSGKLESKETLWGTRCLPQPLGTLGMCSGHVAVLMVGCGSVTKPSGTVNATRVCRRLTLSHFRVLGMELLPLLSLQRSAVDPVKGDPPLLKI